MRAVVTAASLLSSPTRRHGDFCRAPERKGRPAASMLVAENSIQTCTPSFGFTQGVWPQGRVILFPVFSVPKKTYPRKHANSIEFEFRARNDSKIERLQQSLTSIAFEDPLQNLCLRSSSRSSGEWGEVFPVCKYGEKDHNIALGLPGPSSVPVKCMYSHLGRNNDPEKPRIKCKKTPQTPQPRTARGCDLSGFNSIWNKQLTCSPLDQKGRKIGLWPHQNGKSDPFLSIIEAIYFFLVDYPLLIENAKCSGKREMRECNCISKSERSGMWGIVPDQTAK
ncbi:hypothetical protein HPG69_008005 [Diceros bicornis minor]|uniref:Uncharacterized protein n=1 Tax=Diceros bicornis minor TaxID=77932 RepID=A0A7J7EFS4_DICBM|nr:hypothetical protein HPG69_008005 [Diceros bicornis minor]